MENNQWIDSGLGLSEKRSVSRHSRMIMIHKVNLPGTMKRLITLTFSGPSLCVHLSSLVDLLYPQLSYSQSTVCFDKLFDDENRTGRLVLWSG